MKTIKTLLLVFVALCGTVYADTITVVFNFDVTSEYLYASGGYDPSFVPESVTVTATFDDAPTARASDPNNIETFFGVPVVSSPLTAILPYGPGGATINPLPSNTDTLMTDFNFGSGVGDTGSYFQIQENQYDAYGPSSTQFWTTLVQIRMEPLRRGGPA